MLPPPVVEQLKLTGEQLKQVAALETEVKAKVEKILTPAQLEQLKQLGPPRFQGNRNMGGPEGGGGPGGNAGMRPMQNGGNDPFDQGPGPRGPGMQGGGQRGVMPLIEALDLNKDGTIDTEELGKAVESLKKLDKNGDGKLTSEEYRMPRMGGGGGQGMQRQGQGGGFPGGEGRPGGQGQGFRPGAGAGGPGASGGPSRPRPDQE